MFNQSKRGGCSSSLLNQKVVIMKSIVFKAELDFIVNASNNIEVRSEMFSLPLDEFDNMVLEREGKRSLLNRKKKDLQLHLALNRGINVSTKDIFLERWEFD